MILSLWQIKQKREEKVWSREKRVENPIEREENIEGCEERKKERKIPPSIRFFPSRAIGSLPSVDNWRSVSWLGFAKPVSLTLVDPSLTSSSIDSKGSSSNRSFPESYYSFQLKLSILIDHLEYARKLRVIENYISLDEHEIKNREEILSNDLFWIFLFPLVFSSFSKGIRISNMVKAKFTTNQLFPNFIIRSRLY